VKTRDVARLTKILPAATASAGETSCRSSSDGVVWSVESDSHSSEGKAIIRQRSDRAPEWSRAFARAAQAQRD